MKMKSKKRIYWLDNVKFMAMILVIAGHHEIGGETGLLKSLIFTFHMPLFFMISGFFFKDNKLFVNVKKALKSYLPPYLIILALTLLFCCVIRPIIWPELPREMFDYNWILTTSLLHFNGFSVFWFLPCLLVSYILMSLITRIFKNDLLRLLVIIVGLIVVKPLSNHPMYFQFQNALIAVAFMFIGYITKKYFFSPTYQLKKEISHNSIFIITSITSIAVWIYFVVTKNYINMVYQIYPLYPICLLGALGGCIVFLFLVNKLPESKILGKLGQNTMIIFTVHAVEHNFFPWDIYKSNYAEIGTFLIRLALILIVSYVIILIKDKVKLLRTKTS